MKTRNSLPKHCCWNTDQRGVRRVRFRQNGFSTYLTETPWSVVRAGWQHVRGDMISVRQEKTNTQLLIPLHPQLALTLASLPRTNMTFLVTDHGAPYTPGAFSKWFRRQCDAAGLGHCSAHGLRKAAARRFADAGCSVEEIKAMTGHRSLTEVARYVKGADQQRLARRALDAQVRAESEQKLSSAKHPLDMEARND